MSNRPVILPIDYVDWEEHVELYIGDFPHTSFRLGAIIEEKLVGYLGMCWRIYVMGRKMKFSWIDLKEDLREFLQIPADYHRQTLEELIKIMEQGNVNVKKTKSCSIDMSDDEKKDIVEEEVVVDSVKEFVIVEEANIPILEESIDEVRDPYVLEVEVENHDIRMANEGVREIELIKEEPDYEVVVEELEVIDFVMPTDV